LNDSFSTLYHRVFKRHWHSGVYGYMPRNYAETDFQKARYTLAYPTFPDRYGMRYSIINVKVFDRPITQGEADEWFKQLYTDDLIKPNGMLDSRLNVVIAPASEGRRHLRGMYKAKGSLHLLVIDPDPLRAVARLIKQVLRFLIARLKRFFDRTHMEQLWDEFYNQSLMIRSTDSMKIAEEGEKGVWISIKSILNRRSIEILANSVMCLSQMFRRLASSLVEVLKKFGLVNLNIRPLRSKPEKDRLLLENPTLLMEAKNHLLLQMKIISSRLKELSDLEKASNIFNMNYTVE